MTVVREGVVEEGRGGVEDTEIIKISNALDARKDRVSQVLSFFSLTPQRTYYV